MIGKIDQIGVNLSWIFRLTITKGFHDILVTSLFFFRPRLRIVFATLFVERHTMFLNDS